MGLIIDGLSEEERFFFFEKKVKNFWSLSRRFIQAGG
jgi:hypothetical protein